MWTPHGAYCLSGSYPLEILYYLCVQITHILIYLIWRWRKWQLH